MKTILNIAGLLALLGAALVIAAYRPESSELLATISILIAIACFGFGRLIEIAEKAARQLEINAQILVESARHNHAVAAPGASIPPLPGKERYYIANSEGSNGPFEVNKLERFFEKQAITKDTYVLREGSQEWKRFGEVFASW